MHAYILTQGYKLVATGADAEDPAANFSTDDREEVEPTGWDTLQGVYSFRYQDAEGKNRPALFLKCISAGPKLLVQWMVDSGAAPSSNSSSNSSQMLELDTAKYVTEAPAAPAAYQNADELVKLLDGGPGMAVSGSSTAAASTSAAAAAATSAAAQRREPTSYDVEEPEPGLGHGYSPLQEGPPMHGGGGRWGGGSGGGVFPPGIMPSGVGYEDVVPPGVRPPGMGGVGPGFPEGIGGVPHTGGGMMVGPGHPMFGGGSGRLGGGGVGGVGMGGNHGTSSTLPPGARWDPIGPPGTRGFRPDGDGDGNGNRPPVHPDMMQPGPGQGTDWTSFYG